ncbi:hypothetical protein N9N67_11960, partial [Bacteriovoracaceae bacterium]|nr:hypothetical protein [Bacteriovoracaceae bacterium]
MRERISQYILLTGLLGVLVSVSSCMKQRAPEKLETSAFKNRKAEQKRIEELKKRRGELKSTCRVNDLPMDEEVDELTINEKLDILLKKYVVVLQKRPFDTLFDYDCLSINLENESKVKKLYQGIQ